MCNYEVTLWLKNYPRPSQKRFLPKSSVNFFFHFFFVFSRKKLFSRDFNCSEQKKQKKQKTKKHRKTHIPNTTQIKKKVFFTHKVSLCFFFFYLFADLSIKNPQKHRWTRIIQRIAWIKSQFRELFYLRKIAIKKKQK